MKSAASDVKEAVVGTAEVGATPSLPPGTTKLPGASAAQLDLPAACRQCSISAWLLASSAITCLCQPMLPDVWPACLPAC